MGLRRSSDGCRAHLNQNQQELIFNLVTQPLDLIRRNHHTINSTPGDPVLILEKCVRARGAFILFFIFNVKRKKLHQVVWIMVSLTVLVHAHLETLLQSARLALVPVRLVHHAPACPRLTPVKNNVRPLSSKFMQNSFKKNICSKDPKMS
jgi:hypothetical protein